MLLKKDFLSKISTYFALSALYDSVKNMRAKWKYFKLFENQVGVKSVWKYLRIANPSLVLYKTVLSSLCLLTGPSKCGEWYHRFENPSIWMECQSSNQRKEEIHDELLLNLKNNRVFCVGESCGLEIFFDKSLVKIFFYHKKVEKMNLSNTMPSWRTT